VFNQDHALEEQDALMAFHPSGNLIRVKENGFGIAGNVLAETDDLLTVGHQGQTCHEQE
jgi:hypothetical protein